MALFPFSPPAVLAPMESITHPEQRELFAGYGGIGLVVTEFVRVSRAPFAPELVRARTRPCPGAALSVQLMGNDPPKLAEAARVAVQAGADVVDLNLGCPTPRAERRGVGAALLDQPELVADLLARVRAATRVRMSVKLRAGLRDASRALEVAELAEREGVDFITIHPRTGREMYAGVADWSLVAAVAGQLSIPVVGNGDLWYAADALCLERDSGASAVMIGRPALRNPWIFRQLCELRAGKAPFSPGGEDVHKHVLALCDMLSRHLGATHPALPDVLKQQITWLARAVPDGGAFGRAALRLPSVADIVALVAARIRPLPPEALDLDAVGSHRLERSATLASADHPTPRAEPAQDFGS